MLWFPSSFTLQKRASLHHPTVFLLSTWTTGPFPVIKQEQLSPHSLSSQADMSSQQASHDGATGRGRWLPVFESACVFGVGRYGNQAGLATVILKMFAFQLGPQWSGLRTNLRMYSRNSPDFNLCLKMGELSSLELI